MTISYTLQENRLTSDADDFMAMVHPTAKAKQEQVITRMMEQGSTVNKPDILATMEDYFSAVESLVLEGYSVTTPLANFGASIKGVFDGQSDSFDPNRHQLRASVSPGARIRATISERGQAIKGEPVTPRPNLLEFTDIISGERNSVLTPGGMAQVLGHRLKYDAGDADQGVYFVAADGTETKVDVVGLNKPGQLMLMVPASLSSGDYSLQVRAVIGVGTQVRTGSLEETLTMA